MLPDLMLLKKPHILVVDDNEEILSTISLILLRNDYHVSVKSRIDDFEKTLEELSPDIVLLDKSLGWADGCDLCQRIKSHRKLSPIPVIMFSAYSNKKEICMNAGADEFIEKPFEMHTLLDAIQSFTEHARPASC